MKALNIITLALVIVGGVNWGLIAVADLDLVAAVFGADTLMSNIVYGLVGVSAIWQLMPFARAIKTNEVAAEANLRTAR